MTIKMGQLEPGKMVQAPELLPESSEPPWPKWVDYRGAVIPDLMSVYFPDGDAYIWFELVSSGWDLDLEEAEGADEIGPLSVRLQWERDQASWQDMIDMSWHSGWTCILWALENGIAPGQPFLMRFGEPEYTGGGYYEPNEVDVEYDVELIRVIPWSQKRVAKAWVKTLKDREKFVAYRARRDAKLAKARRTRIDCMYRKTDVYFAPGQSTYDDMTMPRGIRYYICSNYRPKDGYGGGWAYLASAQSNDGDHKEAMAGLVEVAAEKLGLTEEQVKKLPRYGY